MVQSANVLVKENNNSLLETNTQKAILLLCRNINLVNALFYITL